MELKSFREYYKKGLTASSGKYNKYIINFYLIEILLYITMPFVLIGTSVRLAYYRLYSNLNKNKIFKLSESFEDSNDITFLKKVMIASLIQRLLITSLILLLSLIGLLFYLIGYGVYLMTLDNVSLIIGYVPLILLSLLFLYYLLFVNIPVEYIYIKDKNVNISNAIKRSMLEPLYSKKRVLILSFIIEFIPKCLLLALIIWLVVYNNKFIVYSAIISIAYLLIFPKFSITHIILRHNVYSDILDNIVINNKINIAKEIFETEDSIEGLFNKNIKLNVENKKVVSDIEAVKNIEGNQELDSFNEDLIDNNQNELEKDNLDLDNKLVEELDEVSNIKKTIEETTESETNEENQEELNESDDKLNNLHQEENVDVEKTDESNAEKIDESNVETEKPTYEDNIVSITNSDNLEETNLKSNLEESNKLDELKEDNKEEKPKKVVRKVTKASTETKKTTSTSSKTKKEEAKKVVKKSVEKTETKKETTEKKTVKKASSKEEKETPVKKTVRKKVKDGE